MIDRIESTILIPNKLTHNEQPIYASNKDNVKIGGKKLKTDASSLSISTVFQSRRVVLFSNYLSQYLLCFFPFLLLDHKVEGNLCGASYIYMYIYRIWGIFLRKYSKRFTIIAKITFRDYLVKQLIH